MKKSDLLLVLAAAAAAPSAFAATACNATSTAPGPTQVDIGTGTFIQQGFKFNCSKNVKLDYVETSATVITVSKACSIKGKTVYAGNSDSGTLTGAAGACS